MAGPVPRGDFAGRRVLVTGGGGFVGSHVADRLLAEGAQVTILDNFSTGWKQFVPAEARLVEADLLDPAAARRALEGCDFVFHLAANADIKDNLLEPRRCIEQNVVATQNLLEAMRSAGVQDVAFASTGSVYGEATVVPTPEDAPFPIQTSLYGTSKLAAEGLLTAYALGYGFRVWIFRFVSLLGPRYTHGHVIDFWRRLRRDPTRLDVLGDGHQKKSYLHVGDCVTGMMMAIARAREPINVFNLGHHDWIEVDQSIEVITTTLGVKPRIVHAGGERGWV
ncbi:MAG TPA: NAD-dependent epimerase/dehydratase family protein, partial [Myxococcaceae bacterium]|nr:NAD-dependent epimerase/dehydratase family protein [Myxococcaceae bacterium]